MLNSKGDMVMIVRLDDRQNNGTRAMFLVSQDAMLKVVSKQRSGSILDP